MDEPVEDGIGDGAIAEIGMPLIDGQLAGDERGAAIVTVIEYFEQIAHVLIGKRGESEVVDYDEICLGPAWAGIRCTRGRNPSDETSLLTVDRGHSLHGRLWTA